MDALLKCKIQFALDVFEALGIKLHIFMYILNLTLRNRNVKLSESVAIGAA